MVFSFVNTAKSSTSGVTLIKNWYLKIYKYLYLYFKYYQGYWIHAFWHFKYEKANNIVQKLGLGRNRCFMAWRGKIGSNARRNNIHKQNKHISNETLCDKITKIFIFQLHYIFIFIARKIYICYVKIHLYSLTVLVFPCIFRLNIILNN